MTFFKALKTRPQVYSLRVWRSETGRVSRKYYLKNTILLGSDKTKDLIIKTASAFEAKINFKSKSLMYIEDGLELEFPEKKLLQISEDIIQWEFKELPSFVSKHLLIWPIFLVGIMTALYAFPSSEEELVKTCSSKQRKTALGKWSEKRVASSSKDYFRNLRLFRKDFHFSMRKKDFLRAKYNLDQLKLMVPRNDFCSTWSHIGELEFKYLEQLVFKLLKSDEILASARLIDSFKSEYPNIFGIKMLETEVLSRAKSLLWKAWRLEKTAPKKSYLIKKQVKRVCQLIRAGALECISSASEAQETSLKR